MKEFSLLVATPAGNAFSGKAEMLRLRGAEGDLAVLADHAPLMTMVSPGKCSIALSGGRRKTAQLGQGLLSVAGGKVTLLSGRFQWLEET